MEHNMDCIYCGEPFTTENPCWNDEGIVYASDGVTPIGHIDGECGACARRWRDGVGRRVRNGKIAYRGNQHAEGEGQ
jgi:hypothetical protein